MPASHRIVRVQAQKMFQIYDWRPEFYNDTNNLPEKMPRDLKAHIGMLKTERPSWVSKSCAFVLGTNKHVMMILFFFLKYNTGVWSVFGWSAWETNCKWAILCLWWAFPRLTEGGRSTFLLKFLPWIILLNTILRQFHPPNLANHLLTIRHSA